MYKWVIILLFLVISCDNRTGPVDDDGNVDNRQEMRWFVEGLSSYAKSINQDFIIVPQNGHELLVLDTSAYPLTPDYTYINAIDGIGREDLFYGYNSDDHPTPSSITTSMIKYMDLAETNSIEVLVTDYCSTQDYIDDSYGENFSHGYVSFAAESRELNTIPNYDPYNANNSNIETLFDVQNFLYLINPENYSSKSSYINSITNTSYDLVIMDYFFDEDTFTVEEVQNLHEKSNGGERLVLAYLSIGEAENYRYYWDDSWTGNKPIWLLEENPNWNGNYKVKYWDSDWQSIIYGDSEGYLDKIIRGGYDGVYLDIIDAYEYFENQ
ncbi:MAG: endo alpha-1,4 polygalactosaminidase [Candidatus Marinimicrobia bacterium]|nr:endo alpha-1,4 polygalactosaminidase [Candidatus Neomarinimicrobiota bacterium]